MLLRATRLIAIASLLVLLAACETAEERAERHYENGMALLAEGDVSRALVEFRNVFKLDETHRGARLAYARAQLDRGELRDAIRNFVILAEQYPDDGEIHKSIAELAVSLQDWEALDRHARRAAELLPADPEVQALHATLLFHEGARDGPVDTARSVIEALPANLPARMILIAAAMERGDTDTALVQADAGLDLNPQDLALNLTRLAILASRGDDAAVEAHFAAMSERFPGNADIERARIDWYTGKGRIDDAERLLRSRAEGGTADDRMGLARSLFQNRDAAAARAYLDEVIADAAAAEAGQFIRARAALDHETGDTEGAVAALRAHIDGAEAADALESRVALAQILDASGDAAAARAEVEAVLESDPTQVDALKMRASALIGEDATELAIRDLRTALEAAPQDAEVLTLMAEAHEREGARELAAERLALAVTVSGNAAPESLRYAAFLMADDRFGPAESVIVDALRLDRDNPELLSMLGRIHLGRGDHDRAAQVVAILRQQGTAGGTAAADVLERDVLAAQDRAAEQIALFEAMASDGRAGLTGAAQLVQSYVEAGRMEDAVAYADALVADNPGDPRAMMLRAGLLAVRGDWAAAEAIYREILQAAPAFSAAYTPLMVTLRRQGKDAEEAQILDLGIERAEDPSQLMLIKALRLEEAGDIDAAIALYEELYSGDSSDIIVANNLASLLSTHRDSAEDLERAYRVARRLRGTDVPPFQDTYGWILVRRGEYEEALGYLVPAAAALPERPLVLYHLGMAHAGAGNRAEATAALEQAIAIAGEDSGLKQIPDAVAKLDELKAAEGDASESGSN